MLAIVLRRTSYKPSLRLTEEEESENNDGNWPFYKISPCRHKPHNDNDNDNDNERELIQRIVVNKSRTR